MQNQPKKVFTEAELSQIPINQYLSGERLASFERALYRGWNRLKAPYARRISALGVVVGNLKEQLEQLTAQNEATNAALADANKKIDDLRGNVASKRAALAKTTTQLQAAQAEINELRATPQRPATVDAATTTEPSDVVQLTSHEHGMFVRSRYVFDHVQASLGVDLTKNPNSGYFNRDELAVRAMVHLEYLQNVRVPGFGLCVKPWVNTPYGTLKYDGSIGTYGTMGSVGFSTKIADQDLSLHTLTSPDTPGLLLPVLKSVRSGDVLLGVAPQQKLKHFDVNMNAAALPLKEVFAQKGETRAAMPIREEAHKSWYQQRTPTPIQMNPAPAGSFAYVQPFIVASICSLVVNAAWTRFRRWLRQR